MKSMSGRDYIKVRTVHFDLYFRLLQDRVVLGNEAGQVLAQALTDMSNEKGWVQMINGTPQYAPISNRISLLKHLKKVCMCSWE